MLGVAALRASLAPPASLPGGPDVAARGVEEAERRARAALAEAESATGPDSLRTARAIDRLVIVLNGLRDRSSSPETIALAGRGVRLHEALQGRDDPELADALSSLVEAMWQAEEYAGAREPAERALAIRTLALGEADALTGQSYYQLAEILRARGEYAESRRLHEKAISVWRAAPGRNDENIASSLHYLGILHWSMGDRAGARELIRSALEMRERILGPDDERVASGLFSLGSLDLLMEERAEAWALFRRAQGIWERKLGPRHPHVARTLTSMARILAAEGDRERAGDYLRQALEIRIDAFGPEHPLVARSLAGLAAFAEDQKDDAEAERLYRRAIAIEERHPLGRGPEMAAALIALGAIEWRRLDDDAALAHALQAEELAREHFRRTSRGLEEEDALRYEATRARGLDLALSILSEPGAADGPASAALRAEESARGFDEVVRSRALVLDAMVRRERLAAGRIAAGEGGPGLREVAAALPASTGLVSYVRHARLVRGGGAPVEAYAAFVLAGGDATPSLVPLGEAAAIDSLIQDWRREAGADPRSRPGGEAETRYLEAGGRLRRALWDPVRTRLGGRGMILVVPDGAINLVSLVTLPDETGRYLLESGPRVHYLSAERDLLPERRGTGRTDGGLLVLGGADFDAAPGGQRASAVRHGPRPACPSFASLSFPPLAGTRGEAREMESLWRGRAEVLARTGPEATEAAFKMLAPGRRILHLATHGYFLDDRCPSSLDGSWSPESGAPGGDSPLLLSGLALAGANRRAEAPGGGEDGILTASEIASLDLSSVEWAVLSACKTGVGKVMAGEGVLGLRRAFLAAGARTLIMSLWAVDDGAARAFMRRLYEHRLSGSTTAGAVAGAGLDLLEQQRRRGATTHPFFWGGFVACGDWR